MIKHSWVMMMMMMHTFSTIKFKYVAYHPVTSSPRCYFVCDWLDRSSADFFLCRLWSLGSRPSGYFLCGCLRVILCQARARQLSLLLSLVSDFDHVKELEAVVRLFSHEEVKSEEDDKSLSKSQLPPEQSALPPPHL